MGISDTLFSSPEKDYGDNYKPHLLEQYKLYVEMADRISSRRQIANSFFLSINTAIVAIVGYAGFGSKNNCPLPVFWVIGLCGMILCYTWYRLIRSYRDLNTGKFKVIHEIEKKLPLSPYDAEWVSIGEGNDPKLYLPFTHIEVAIPWIFLILHFIVILGSMFFISAP